MQKADRTDETTTVDLGRRGEMLAERALKRAGMRLLARNYRAGHYEIDRIFRERRTGFIVFVEVKARSGTAYGLAREAVTPRKQRFLRQAAERYLFENDLLGAPCRFDVVEVDLKDGRIERIENAF